MRFESHAIRASQSDSQRHLRFELLVLMALLLVALGSAPSSSAQASDVYITPDGSGQGVCTNSPHPPAWFNSSGNWGTGGTQIGPGTTVHLCGTFTGAAGATLLTFQGNGASGNPVTLLFEAGATLTAPYWSTSGAIRLGSHSQIIVDGGSNGVIQANANGSALANKQTNSGITTFGGNVEIRNLTIANLYVHSSTADSAVDQTGVNCISFSGSNVLIHDNIMHDAGWCLYENSSAGDGNVSIYNNTIYNIDHGWALAPSGHTASSGPFSFYSNTVYGYSVWDTQSNDYHHDGIHCYTSQTGGVGQHITALNIYNNLFKGPVGANVTGHIFLEGGNTSGSTPCMDSTSHGYVYNNVFLADGYMNDGLVGLYAGNLAVYNNTIVGKDSTGGVCYGSGSDVSSVVFKNNVVSSCNQLVSIQSPFTPDYNIYASGGSNSFVCNGNFSNPSQLSNWQSCTGGDSHSSYNASAGLSSTGVPQAGSPVIGAGTNLTSLGITALDWDTTDGNSSAPVQRPATGPWDVSAYLFGGAAVGAPNAPTSLIAVVN